MTYIIFLISCLLFAISIGIALYARHLSGCVDWIDACIADPVRRGIYPIAVFVDGEYIVTSGYWDGTFWFDEDGYSVTPSKFYYLPKIVD